MEEMSKTFQYAFSVASYNHDLSIKLYDKEIKEVDPKNFAAWNNRGVSKVELGKESKNKQLILDGIEDFKKAITLADEFDKQGYSNAERNIQWAKLALSEIEKS